jgi:hypothetical protein
MDMTLSSCAGADVIDFAVSVPVSVPAEGENELNAERVRFGHRVERRYSEFASFKTVIDQLRLGLVRHSAVTLCSTTHLPGDLPQPVADCRR